MSGEPGIYVVYGPDGRVVATCGGDIDAARRWAQAIDGVIVALPVLEDYRPKATS